MGYTVHTVGHLVGDFAGHSLLPKRGSGLCVTIGDFLCFFRERVHMLIVFYRDAPPVPLSHLLLLGPGAVLANALACVSA